MQSTLDKFNSKDKFVRLWRNETSRVFVDPLLDYTDKDLVNTMLTDIIKAMFADVADSALPTQ
jgi:uncharacterized protein YprB with RNaseH-like and TPR domain